MGQGVRSFGMIWVLCFYLAYVYYLNLAGGTFFEVMLMSMVFGIAIIIFGQDNNK